MKFNSLPKRPMFLTSFLAFASVLVLVFVSGATVSADKMDPQEVVAKHLASVGTPEALAEAKSRIVVGTVDAKFRLTSARVEVSGPAEIASDGNKVLLAMAFTNVNNYPHEKAAFDGQKVTVGILPSGGRSKLADFLISQELVVRQGLLGGTLSSAWPLYNLDTKTVKLSYAGTDKINNRPAHKIKYSLRNEGNLRTTLYFDAETFQHVRSQYEYSVPASSVSVATQSAGQRESRFKLVEDFSDFQPTGKLTLPHKYHLDLLMETQDRTQTMEWDLTLSQFSFNQPIAPEEFNVGKTK